MNFMCNIIHKVKIREEAKFDYEEAMQLVLFPKELIINELEEFLNCKKNKYENNNYFKVRLYDNYHEDDLMLFIRRGKHESKYQYWEVVGICYAFDYDEDLEFEGIIKAWLDSEIKSYCTKDWVARQRLVEIMGIAKEYKINNLSKELKKHVSGV